ncbi:MAG: hypothetical protein O3B97_02745 [Actinomycetota bacterium]|nr:hypothetical protein [Actinomycetota bacterium]
MSAITEETAAPQTALDRMRDRAISDYLAVSRNSGVYSSTDDYLAAEERAWDRLQAAVGRARRVEESALA